MVFKLVRTDIIDAHKIELPVGEHLFGRGKFLDCEDKRISRKHGQLQVTEDTVVLKSLHQNPCFFSKCGSDEVIILKLDSVTELSHGDRFGLLPTSYWYEVLYTSLPANENQPNRIQNNVNSTLAETQPMEDVIESNIPDVDKIINNTILNGRSESPTFSQDGNSQDETGFGNDSELLGVNFDEPVEESHRSASPSLIPPDNAPTTEPPPISPDPDALSQPPAETPSNLHPSSSSPTKRANPEELHSSDVKKVKAEPQDCDRADDELDVAGPSNPLQPVKPEPVSPVKAEPASPVKPPSTPHQPQPGPSRERCFYGARCYRKNPQHKADFSHPSDTDWGSGDVGQCPHGAACIKRDPRHWQTHIHPPGTQQPSNQYQPGMRLVRRHGNIFYINAHTVNFYDDHVQAVDSEDDSVDFDYEF